MRMPFFVKQVHLLLGLFSGLIVFIVAITGCLYCFEEQVRNIVYKDLLTVKAETSPMSFTQLLDIAEKQYPSIAVKNIKIKNKPESSIEVTLKNKLSIFINPYNGKILGTVNKEKDFFGVVLKIHRTLFLDKVGKFITGTSAAIFLLMIISGIFLWWPKSKRHVKQKFSIKKNVHWKKTVYDSHSILGFYAAWILLFVASTGIIWSFKWAENTMYKLSNSVKQAPKPVHSLYSNAAPINLTEITAAIENKYTKPQEYIVVLPEDSIGTYRVIVRVDDAGFFKKQDQLFFDQYTGAVLQTKLFLNASTGDKLKATNYNIHTGKVFGIVGQFIVFFASLIAASLPITGFIMWRNRRGINSVK